MPSPLSASLVSTACDRYVDPPCDAVRVTSHCRDRGLSHLRLLHVIVVRITCVTAICITYRYRDLGLRRLRLLHVIVVLRLLSPLPCCKKS